MVVRLSERLVTRAGFIPAAVLRESMALVWRRGLREARAKRDDYARGGQCCEMRLRRLTCGKARFLAPLGMTPPHKTVRPSRLTRVFGSTRAALVHQCHLSSSCWTRANPDSASVNCFL